MRVDLFFRVITGADHRSGFDVAESEGFSADFPLLEFVGVDPAFDRKMLRGRLQVLSEGEDVAGDGNQVIQHGFDLVSFFTEPEHHSGFCDKRLLLCDLEEF